MFKRIKVKSKCTTEIHVFLSSNSSPNVTPRLILPKSLTQMFADTCVIQKVDGVGVDVGQVFE